VGLPGYSLNTRLSDYLDAWEGVETRSDLPIQNNNLPQPWPIEARLTAAQTAQLIADYRAGATSRDLATQLGVSKSAIVRLLRRHGAVIRPRGSRPT
jgi:predicted DNA binding protein